MTTTAIRRDDAAIGQAVRQALRGFMPFVIPVVEDGVVTLRGWVRSYEECQTVRAATSSVPGVRRVVDELFVGDPGE